jgi:lysophospholipase L1-like esterase
MRSSDSARDTKGSTGDSPLSKASANFGLAVASAALFLGLLEGGARVYDRCRNGAPLALPDPMETLYRPHPYLPIALRPSSDYRDGDTSGHINALGLRGPERDAAKPSGVFRIVCVGGSTTFGAGIVGDENTYPARLEALLSAARPDLSIEVLNAGVPGYTTAENVIYLSLRLLDLEPDLVVLYEGYNDFKPNRYPGFRSDYSHWRDRAVAPARAWLEVHSRLYTKLRSLTDRYVRDASAGMRDPRTGAGMRRYDTVSDEGLKTFRRNLKTMIAAARSAGAQTAVATYAHPVTEENLRDHPDLLRYLPGYLPNLTFEGARDAFDKYNEAARAVAHDEKIPLIDAAVAIPPDPALFVDHVHFNAAGADRFAGVVAGAIAPALPAPASRADADHPRARHRAGRG